VADDFCTSCGLRADSVTVDDRGALAYATHRGRRHHRNEDAAALGLTAEGHPVLVVVDGVSNSPNPDLAAQAATGAAIAALAGQTFTEAALLDAVRAAQEAAAKVPADGDDAWSGPADAAPACTLVIVVATPTTIHSVNVGDCRGYLVTGPVGRRVVSQLSVDDSVAAQAVRDGADASVALAGPGGHAITAWLGADAPDVQAHHVVHEWDESGAATIALACSDGLWNYTLDDSGLAARLDVVEAGVTDAEEGALGLRCKTLVDWANEQGGADNITVAMARLGARPGPPPEGVKTASGSAPTT
jgi:serine/threonine protein phosphatase PrpC